MRIFFITVFGIILPTVTLLIEMASSMCATEFFDPIPTLWHAGLVALVPSANLLCLLAGEGYCKRPHVSLAYLNGLAIGIAAVYTLLFLPLLPLAIIAVLFMGWGLLPMAPLFSLIAAGICRHGLQQSAMGGLPKLWLWAPAGVALLLAVEVPGLITRMGVSMATSTSPDVRARGLSWLRRWGSQDDMLRLCYRRSPGVSIGGAVMDTLTPVSTNAAQGAFFRATGHSHKDFPAPKHKGRRWDWESDRRDLERRDTSVSPHLHGLSLASSQIDATIDHPAALAYLEWTMLFRNTSYSMQEARAQVLLPPGGVVSRLTLWVNGEPREAAFAGSSQVREAYEAIVRQKKDPVLVTLQGPDRIGVQCFPVPPNGGEMKIRIGISTPLALRADEKAYLQLPSFTTRNFDIATNTRHDVWAEAEQPLTSSIDSLRPQPAKNSRHAFRGSLTDKELAMTAAHIQLNNFSPAPRAWTPDLLNKDQVIVQEIRKTRETPPGSVVVVVDGSVALAPFMDEIAHAVLAASKSANLILAADAPIDLSEDLKKWRQQPASNLALVLRELCSGGGCDNIPALIRGWDSASAEENSALVWIHGAQPVVMEPAEPLLQRFRRAPDAVRLFTLSVGGGTNRVLEQLKGVLAVQSVARTDSLTNDLRHVFAQLSDQPERSEFVRRRIPLAEAIVDTAQKASSHLARLWANDQVGALLRSGPNADAEASKLAASYQLVTLLTGAVVLETQEQYDRAKLKPGDAKTVPDDFEPGGGRLRSGPEPAFWLLLSVVALVFIWEFARRRRRCWLR